MSSSPLSVRARPVLADRLPGALVRDVVLVVGFAVAIAASAQLAVPVYGTPILVTGQTLAVLLGAAVLGPSRATAGTLLYAGVGFAGVPWFAVSGGASIGYIAGFVLAAALVGRLARSGLVDRPLGAAAAMVAGNLVILACGTLVLGWIQGLGVVPAIMAGTVPFLLGDAIKVAIATAVLPVAQRFVAHD